MLKWLKQLLCRHKDSTLLSTLYLQVSATEAIIIEEHVCLDCGKEYTVIF